MRGTALLVSGAVALSSCGSRAMVTPPDADPCGGAEAEATACVDAGSVQEGPPRRKGGALVIPWNVDLRWVDSPHPGLERVVAVTAGASTVELLEIEGQSLRVTALPPPPPSTCRRVPSPIAVAVLDADADGRRDFLVFDPECGPRASLQQPDGSFAPRPMGDVLPGLPVYYYFDAIQWTAGAVTIPGVYAAHAGAIAGAVRIDTRWASVPALGFGAPLNFLPVTNLVFSLPGDPSGVPMVLFQRGQFLQELTLDGQGALSVGRLFRPQPGKEYLRGFDAFDHATPIPREQGCGQAFLGVGLFDRTAGAIPRHIQLVQFTGDMFTPSELDLGFEVVSFEPVVTGAGSLVLGVLARGAGGRLFFAVALLAGCSHLELKSRAAQDLTLDTLPNPPDYEMARVPLTDAVKIVARPTEAGGAMFAIYDGFELHVYRTSGDLSAVDVTAHDVHGSRSDLIWDTR